MSQQQEHTYYDITMTEAISRILENICQAKQNHMNGAYVKRQWARIKNVSTATIDIHFLLRTCGNLIRKGGIQESTNGWPGGWEVSGTVFDLGALVAPCEPLESMPIVHMRQQWIGARGQPIMLGISP